MHHFTEQQWIDWFDQLSRDGYLVVDNFISDELYADILTYFNHLKEQDGLSKAGIGASGRHQIDKTVRGDLIYWLDSKRDEQLSDFFNLADEMVAKIKRYCFLSITDYEFHLAYYPPGTHYEKHIDQFQGRNNRMLSVLVYLNENWTPADGGQLKIYRPDTDLLIEPVARRLVIFKSDTVEHEVLITHAGRMSLTGWLLHQPSSLGYFIS
jgi:SM-20-related protein